MSIVLDKPEQIAAYRAMAIAKGLQFYAKTGMQINRMYTPKNMMAAAAEITGKKFKARDYLGAADALMGLVVGQAAERELAALRAAPR